MARNELKDSRAQANDPAHLCAGAHAHASADASADSWRALASVTVASVLVVAVVVSVLALLEAVLSKSALKLARQAPAASDGQSRHATAP